MSISKLIPTQLKHESDKDAVIAWINSQRFLNSDRGIVIQGLRDWAEKNKVPITAADEAKINLRTQP